MATSEELLFVLRMQDAMSAALAPVVTQLNALGSSADDAKTSLDSISGNTALMATQSGAEAAASSMLSFRTAIASAAAAFVALKAGDDVMKSTLGTFGNYEQILLSVEKYSSMNQQQMHTFAEGFDALAASMPLPIEELGKMAALAASLGIQGPENINNFTSAVAKLSVASNLSGENLVKSIARMQNIFQEPANEALQLVSVIERVDNSTAATGRDVVRMAMDVAQATAAFHIGTTEATAIGGALAQLGVNAERGGTAVGRVFQSLREAASGELPKALTDLQGLLGMTTSQIAAIEKSSPTQLFDLFIQKLGQLINSGYTYDGLLKDLNLSQQLTGKSIVALATNWQSLGEKEIVAFNALSEQIPRADQEFAVFSQGLQQRIQLVSNNFDLLGKTIGGAVAPQAKAGLDQITAALQAVTQEFKSLSPSAQKAVADVIVFGGTFVGAATGVGLLVAALRTLGPLMFAGPWGIAAVAIGAVAAAVLTLNGAFDQEVEISTQTADLIARIAGNSTDAASAIGLMTDASRSYLELQTAAKLDELNQKLSDLKTAMTTDFAGQPFWQRVVNGLAQADGVESNSQTKLQQMLRMYTDGVASVDYFTQGVMDLAKSDPTLEKQALEVLTMGQNWAALNNQVNEYQLALSRLQNTNIPSQSSDAQQIYKSASEVGPPEATAGKNYAMGTGGGAHAQQVQQFITETNARIQAMNAETAAMGQSEAAYQAISRAEKEEADVRAVAKRAADLKLDTQATADLVAEYKAAADAYAQAQQQENLDKEVAGIETKIKDMGLETEALEKGKLAYDAYKASSKVDDQSAAYAQKLEDLGMEESAVRKLVQAYKDQANALATATTNYEQMQQQVAELKSLGSQMGSAFETAFDNLTTGGKTLSQTMNQLAQDISKAIMQALLFKPLETYIGNEVSSLFGSGGGSNANPFSLLGSLLGLGASGAGATATEGVIGNVGSLSGSQLTSSFGVAGLGFHKGGVVSNDGASFMRVVDASVFSNAPRYHDGLGNDEIAAILQRGERVITANQNQQLQSLLTQVGGNSGGVAQSQPNIVFNITTPNPSSFMASQSQIYGKAAAALRRTSVRNGAH